MKSIPEALYAYMTLIIVVFMFLIFLDGSTKPADMALLALMSVGVSTAFLPVLLAVELLMAALAAGRTHKR